MFDKQNYRRVAGLAGAITQSGAVIKSVQSDVRHDPGMPVKLSSGKAVALAGSEKAGEIFGIAIKPVTPFEPFYKGDLIEVLHEGYIQVPIDDGKTYTRGGAVYFDHATKKYTTDDTKVAIRAVWACDGHQNGVAEIQLITYLATPSAAA